MPRLLPAVVMAAFMLFAASASAHVERPAYWPDPAADTSIKPATGGKVPKARSLVHGAEARSRRARRASSASENSMALLRRSVGSAQKNGYDIRPSDHRVMKKKAARKLLRFNKRLAKKCKFREIQAAVNASGNNDRVVIMPGLYEEPTSRAKPTNDPACDPYRTNGDKPGPGGHGALVRVPVQVPERPEPRSR